MGTQQPDPEPQNGTLYGVHGWLALFVFLQLIADPIIFATTIVRDCGIAITPGADSFPSILLPIIDAVVLSGFACWSVYCGICLLKLRPSAPRTNTRYLIALFSYYALGMILEFAGTKGFVPGLADIGDALSSRFIQGFIPIIGWYAYLKTSLRVKNTYRNTSG